MIRMDVRNAKKDNIVITVIKHSVRIELQIFFVKPVLEYNFLNNKVGSHQISGAL